jgi:hypothetical protein
VRDNPGWLKAELSLTGVRLDPGIQPGLHGDGDGAIELLLPDDVWVQAPVDPRWTSRSPFTLVADGTGFRLRRADEEGAGVEVRVLVAPGFVQRRTASGTPMGRLARVHGTFLAIDPGAACGFGSRGVPCAFCRGSGPAEASSLPSINDVIEVVRAAFDEGAAEIVYFYSRCTDAADGGIELLRPYVQAVKRHFDTLIAVQVSPPGDVREIDRTYALGVDAVSYNLELWDEAALTRVCPGRARRLGRGRFVAALEHAAAIFPAGTVWTELAVGVEPFDVTRAAIEALAGAGVVPVLSVASPAATAAIPGLGTPAAADVAPVYAHLYDTVKRRKTPMTWIRDLPIGMTPLDARFFVDAAERAPIGTFYRSRLGTLATRSLSRLRRRLRVRTVSESFDSSQL